MKQYRFTRIETIKSICIIQADSQEQAEKQLEICGFDESLDDITSSNIEVEEIKETV